ncbi:MAG: hypothetical protein MAGBODY4_00352 [Candidatus Marinimicrobia bacterium]|nr:hypothetical protein [Candidatus Neomarinimicrobiota bacterium]
MKTYRIPKISEPPALDGTPSGHLWETTSGVLLVDCVSGEKPKLATQVRLLWDDDYLYVGYEVEDNRIIANFTKRDEPLWQEDVVELFLSPSGSEHYYYEFNFSPREVILDLIVLNDGGHAGEGRGELVSFADRDVKGLRVSTHIHENQNWSATVAIPFRELHFAGNQPPAPGDEWRANLCRIEYGEAEEEYSTWSPTGLVDFHTSEKFGVMVFDGFR